MDELIQSPFQRLRVDDCFYLSLIKITYTHTVKKGGDQKAKNIPLARLLIGVLSIDLVFGFSTGTRSDLAVSDANLNSNGASYVINPDEQGSLWISGYSSSEVWGQSH